MSLLRQSCIAYLLIVLHIGPPGSETGNAEDKTEPVSPGVAAWLPPTDVGDRKIDPRSWQQAKWVALVFLNPECPVVNSYAPELARLSATFPEVVFLGIHSDPSVTKQQAAKHAEEFALPFTVVMDGEQHLAARVGVRATPEVALVASDGTVHYRGRIDDRYSETGKRRDEPRRRDLERAMRNVVAGEPVEVPQTKAVGCPIPFRKETKPKQLPAKTVP